MATEMHNRNLISVVLVTRFIIIIYKINYIELVICACEKDFVLPSIVNLQS